MYNTEWHFLYAIGEYLFLQECTYLGTWNLILGSLGMVELILRQYLRMNKTHHKHRIIENEYNISKIERILSNIRIIVESTFIPLIYYYFMHLPDSHSSLLLLLPCPNILSLLLSTQNSLPYRLNLLIYAVLALQYLSLGIYNKSTTDPIIQFILVMFFVQLILYIIKCRNTDILPKAGNNLNIEQKKGINWDALNMITFPILIYNTHKGLMHKNSAFETMLIKLQCTNFEEFSEKCRLSKEGTSLENDIKDKIQYFNSTEALLQNMTELTADFKFGVRDRNTNHINNINNKNNIEDSEELEIKYCKRRGIGKNNILVIIEENEKERIEKENKIVRRYKNVISKSICHDLKSPLNGIITPLENIPEKYKDELPLQIILTSARFLEYKIEDMIDYSQLELNEFRPINQTLNIRDLISNLDNLCKTHAQLEGLKLKIELDRNIPDRIMSDRKRITQIMLHLLQNALKYTKSGVIIMYVKRVGENVEFGVKDPGIGMNLEVIGNLRQLISRGIGSPILKTIETDLIDSTTEMGLGLGLCITGKICEGIGSKLDFVSKEGRGTKFFFEIANKEKSSSFVRYNINTNDEVSKATTCSGFKAKSKTLIRCDSLQNMKDSGDNRLRRLNTEGSGSAILSRRQKFTFKSLKLNLKSHSRNDTIEEEQIDLLRVSENISRFESMEYIQEAAPRRTMSMYKSKTTKRARDFGLSPQRSSLIVNTSEVLFPSNVPHRVLLVDDMPVNRLVLRLLFKKLNIQVEEASNGQIAVDMCRNQIQLNNLKKPYDIIFMDIEMPIMDGLLATRTLLTMFKTHSWANELPIIAVTAYDTLEMKEQSIAAGMTEFTLKPIKVPQLHQLLRKYSII